jgi:hypothetical protein
MRKTLTGKEMDKIQSNWANADILSGTAPQARPEKWTRFSQTGPMWIFRAAQLPTLPGLVYTLARLPKCL